MKLFLGVDGGNTKTVALVATEDGIVIGAGRSGCSDIFNAESEASALHELDRAVAGARDRAGATSETIAGAVFCLAGADWPEDFAFLSKAIAERAYAQSFRVANDALAGLRAGTPDGTGIILSYGTGGAIAARNRRGDVWHSGFWATEPLGGGALGRLALQAAVRAELGLSPPTSLARHLVSHFGVADVEALLRLHNGRAAQVLTNADASRLAPLVLAAAVDGDPIATAIVADQARLMADYGRAATRKVGLVAKDTAVVLTGGVFRHTSGLMSDLVTRHLGEDYGSISITSREPAIGALMLAMESTGIEVTRERLAAMERSAPSPDFYRTAD